MDGTKSKQRDKFAKMSKSRRETIDEQSVDAEDDMVVDVRQTSTSSSYSSSSSCSASGKGSQDPGVVHRLTFRADPELLEPPGKQRKKLSRNEIEKFRRDRLNAYFMELAKLVPLVMQSNKKIDKASILRLTVAYLRIYHDLVKGSKRSKLSSNWRPDLTMYENLGNLLLESFGGFLLVINKKGILIFATEAITKYLGHSLSDVLGSEVKNVIHPNDYEILMRQFEMTESDGRIKDTDDETDMAHVPVSGRRSFCIKMLNVLDPQSTSYELMHLVGHLKRMPPVDGDGMPTTFSDAPLSPEPSVCLVAVAKLVSRQPIQELYPVMDSTPNQWITRHELDGKITYSDQRGALLTGFLPGESIGFSPYSLLHPDDVSSVVTVHNLFLENGCVPLTVFRMFTKSREILYVQTNTHMVIDTWTSKPKFIISINTVLDERSGLLALEDQSRRIEDKKRCIEVVRSTCDTPLSSHSSHASDESSQSLQEPRSVTSPLSESLCPDVDCIIPEVEEVDDSTIDIVVGLRKFRIQMAENPKFDPRSPPHNFSSINMVFDNHATKDDGGKSIPIVLPSFLSGASSSSSSNHGTAASSHANSLSPSTRSCSSVIEMPGVDAEVDQDRPSQSSSVASVLRRCVATDDASSLAELLLQKDGVMTDVGKMAQNRDATKKAGGQHLLLRQLLVDKTHANTNLRNALVDTTGAVVQSTARVVRKPKRMRVSSLESMPKSRDEVMYGEFSQIKSLLRDGREPSKRSAPAGFQNGQTVRIEDPDSEHGAGSHPSYNGVGHLATSPSSTVLPSNTAALGNGHRSSESHGVAAFHQIPSSSGGIIWPETMSRVDDASVSMNERFTNDHCMSQGLSHNANGTTRDSFTSYVSGNGLAMGQNGKYNGLETHLHVVTSQGSCSNPSEPFTAEVQRNRCVCYLSASDSDSVQEMDCDTDIIHSSVARIISRLPSADKYKFLKHLMAEQEKVYTIDSSQDDPAMRDCETTGTHLDDMLVDQLNCEKDSLQSTYTTEQSTSKTGQLTYVTGQSNYMTGQSTSKTGQSTYVTGQSNYATGQSTSHQRNEDAVTTNGWCQGFGVTGDGGHDPCSNTLSTSSLNCCTLDPVIGFDDSLFLAQQNDISDWKSLVNDDL